MWSTKSTPESISKGSVTSCSRNSKSGCPRRCSIFRSAPVSRLSRAENGDAFGQKAIAHMRSHKSRRSRDDGAFQHNLECSIYSRAQRTFGLCACVMQNTCCPMLDSQCRFHAQLSLPEKIVLAILICLSAAGFWYRFRRVVRIISAARPDPDFRSGIGLAACASFVREVLLQSKVIRAAPAGRPGARVRLLGILRVRADHDQSHRHRLRRAVAFAHRRVRPVLFRVCRIVRRRRRRFDCVSRGAAILARPIWLGKVSPESGIIAGLIFLLMVTYLAGLCAAGKRRGRAHRLVDAYAGAAGVPAADSPHQTPASDPEPGDHFPEAAAASATSRSSPATKISDWSPAKTSRASTRCRRSPAWNAAAAREHCPAYNTGKVLNPKEVILGPARLSEHRGAVRRRRRCSARIFPKKPRSNARPAAPANSSARSVFSILPIIIGLRRGAVNTGAWEDSYGTKLFLTMERNGNSLGLPSNERQKFIEKNALPDLRRHAGVLPLAGLHGRLRSRRDAKRFWRW